MLSALMANPSSLYTRDVSTNIAHEMFKANGIKVIEASD